MRTETYKIAAGDYARGGKASRRLKESLQKIGVDPEAVRRAVIAGYEAEMNVMIYAREGLMRVTFGPGRIDVEVADSGPGIADIDKAMQEGFSTAPPEARKLGFGAGMGLPNIKQNSDSFGITSREGLGTFLQFSIEFQSQEAVRPVANSVRVDAGLCRRCLRCVQGCPLGAVRVRETGPEILDHLCIDCTDCIRECESGALAMIPTAAAEEIPGDAALVVPEALLFQFGSRVPASRVLAELAGRGFSEVLVLSSWETALREAVNAQAKESSVQEPVISPACPAVLNLVAARFPALIPNVAPFLTPIEAAAQDLAGRRVVFAVACPAQLSALGDASVVAASDLCRWLMPALAESPGVPEVAKPRTAPDECGVLRAEGVRHALRVLDAAERGLLSGVPVLELYACEGGCFGSSLLLEDAGIGAYLAARAGGVTGAGPAGARRRRTPLTARGGYRLDADMQRAISKLGRISQLIERLPGRDCGVCGCPSCAALAEDVVLGRAWMDGCPYLEEREEAGP